MRITRHNGRAGVNGVYNPKHNDRNFDIAASEHIDEMLAKRNVYYTWLDGLYTPELMDANEEKSRFVECERIAYGKRYTDHIIAQNERNEKTRHTERNRTVDDLLSNKKTCPEETIYQIGESYEGRFRVGMGAEAIKELLQNIDIETESVELKEELKDATVFPF